MLSLDIDEQILAADLQIFKASSGHDALSVLKGGVRSSLRRVLLRWEAGREWQSSGKFAVLPDDCQVREMDDGKMTVK
jgi:hypothetical protein